jgi:hypothetical protein
MEGGAEGRGFGGGARKEMGAARSWTITPT